MTERKSASLPLPLRRATSVATPGTISLISPTSTLRFSSSPPPRPTSAAGFPHSSRRSDCETRT
jgi:hypothetical protein